MSRHQFYLQARVELAKRNLVVRGVASAVQVCALAAQAEFGDANGTSLQSDFYENCLPNLPWNVSEAQRDSSKKEFPKLSKPLDTEKEEWISQVLKQHYSLKVINWYFYHWIVIDNEDLFVI